MFRESDELSLETISGWSLKLELAESVEARKEARTLADQELSECIDGDWRTAEMAVIIEKME